MEENVDYINPACPPVLHISAYGLFECHGGSLLLYTASDVINDHVQIIPSIDLLNYFEGLFLISIVFHQVELRAVSGNYCQ